MNATDSGNDRHRRHVSISGRRLAKLAAALVLTATVASGCDSDFKPASYIERTRVVGARLNVEGDATRAWAQPGETVTVTWFTVGRHEPATLSWAFALCAGADRACDGAPLAMLTGQGPTATVSFAVPGAAVLGAGHAPQLLGAICADGTLGFDEAHGLPTCTGAGASGTNAAFALPVQVEGTVADANHHPNLSNEALQFNGADWPATPSLGQVDGACDAGSGLPVVSATPTGKGAVKQKLRLISDGDDRERYLQGDPAVATREELQLSQFTTAGKLTYSYASIAATDDRPDADVTLEWEPPPASEVPAEGRLVQFHFVARDLRGGIDWIHRSACVVAP